MTKGERIKYLRKKHNLSQDKLADLLNVSKQAIWKYEHNTVTNIPIDKIELMANIFHVTPEYICCWDIGAGNVNEDEQELLYFFRLMNSEGKTELLNYASYISGKNIYKKSDTIEVI